MRALSRLAMILALGAVATTATAADLGLRRLDAGSFKNFDSRWFVHVGPGAVILSESAKMNAGGAPISGASVKIDPQITPVVEIGYRFTPNFSVSLTGGLPPKIQFNGTGPIAGLGPLGDAVYGPATLTAQYRFAPIGAFHPYIGAGVAVLRIFSTTDRALTNLRIADAVGPAFQIGAEFMFNDRWGMFVDVKKAFLRTEARGTLGPVPVRAKVTLDPLVLHSGVVYRF